MTTVVSRREWNARPPRYTNALDWSQVRYFVVHYSGAFRAQSVRAIQDWCMDGKGHSDIDYNELTRDGVLYVGRGDNKGGHTLNLNSSSYGICVIGSEGDATEADLRVLQERYVYACGRAGRTLSVVGHSEAPGQNPTSCPGPEILDWIHRRLVAQAQLPMPNNPNWTEKTVNELPMLERGSKGPMVRRLQALANVAGAGLSVDGDFGPKTDAAVRRLQGNWGLQVDGEVGKKTWPKLLGV